MRTKEELEKSIFRNPFLEAMTKTNIIIHIIWYAGVSSGMVLWGYYLAATKTFIIVATFIAGFLSWTFIEYIMHRFVFHFISKNKILYRFHYTFHGIHHKFPLDERRTMMPPVPGLFITLLSLGLSYPFLKGISFYFVGGIALGYLIYSSVHYSIHKFRPPKIFRFLWTHHLIHHFQQPEKAYGVSTTFWDKVFKTMPDYRGTKHIKD